MNPSTTPEKVSTQTALAGFFCSPYWILVAGVLMQMCLGATYSWSVFVGPIRKITGIGQGPAQLPLSMFYVAFPVTLLFARYFMAKLGPRLCAMFGGVLFGGGWVLASYGDGSFPLVKLGIGVLSGVGVGFAYLVPIAICIEWFPRSKGLVTGIAVAGFGGGAALLSLLENHLMDPEKIAFTPFQTFRILGCAFLVIVVLAGMVMRHPPGSKVRLLPPMPMREVLGMRRFQLLYLAMFTGLVAGIGVNGNVSKLCRGADPGAGVIAVACFAIANAMGRIVWGKIFDHSKPKTVLTVNLLCQAVTLCLSFFMLRSSFGLEVFALLVGFNYGGVLVLYASTVAHTWGGERVGQIYGWMFSANAFASRSPKYIGLWYDHWNDFTAPLVLVGLILFGAALMLNRTWESTEPKPSG